MIALMPRRLNTMFRRSATAVSLILLSSSAFALTLAESTFDPGMNFDGWTGVECENPGLCPIDFNPAINIPEGPLGAPDFVHASSDPQTFEPGDGYLEIIDPGSDSTGLYDAPSAFTTMIAPGTTLELDFKVNGVGGSYDNDDLFGLVPLFYIENTTAGVGIAYLLPEAAIPIGTWLEFSIPIVANGPGTGPGTWFAFGAPGIGEDNGTGFSTVFAGGDITLRIWGELTKDAADADGTQLDNVRLTAVPVPAALPMMLGALGVFGLWRRKS